MKNKFTLLANIFILGIGLLSNVTHPISVYLENNYGETLNYKTTATDQEGKNIGTNVRVLLGDANSLIGLWIRTTSMISSYFSSSSYYDLKRFIDEIQTRRFQRPNDDAIISIDWDGTRDWAGAKKWNPNLRWEKASKLTFDPLTGAPKTQPSGQPLTQPAVTIEIDLKQFEKEDALMKSTTADIRLQHIKNGALGTDYARKATEICSADYTQAKKLGKIDLCSRLKSEIMAPKFTVVQGKKLEELIAMARAEKKDPRIVHPNLAPAIEDIKNSINRIHNALAGYKNRGEAS